jgi:pimeloyl-ACP methyl ester carboxylesterase
MRALSAPGAGGAAGPRAARRVGGAVLALGALQLLRTALRVRRELAAYRARDARLEAAWTTVRGPAGRGPLRVHARVRDDVPAGPPGALPPVVLVHGYGVSSSYLVPLAAALADVARVYAPDLPGHGRSEHDARPLTVLELAAALAAWMDAWELRGALLVGHSFGCQIAAEVAVRRPELAAGLVLIGPTADPAARTAVGQLARGVPTAAFERPTFGVWAARDYARAGARVLAAEMRSMVSYRLEDVLPAVAAPGRAVPVRVVRGAHDYLAPQRWAERVARLAGAPPPTVVPGWGHAVHYGDPDAVARLVLALARSVAGAGPGAAARGAR